MADIEEYYQVTYEGEDEETRKAFDELNQVLIRISEKIAQVETLAES
jgi:hypothetical protein